MSDDFKYDDKDNTVEGYIDNVPTYEWYWAQRPARGLQACLFK